MTTLTYDTYNAVGNREDLADAIYNIDPYDTPLMMLAGRKDASNVNFDWQTEKLAVVDLTNAQLEGFDITRTSAQPTVRVGNTCQISERQATVSGSQEAADPAGKRKEMAHQMAIASKALKRDMESILSQNQGREQGNETTARTTRAFESWIETNTSRGSDGTDAPDENSPPLDATAPNMRALDETIFLDTMQLCYTNGAEPNTAIFGPYNKRVASTFVGRANSRQAVGKNDVEQSVTVYASDYGDLEFLPSRWSRERSALLVDPDYIKVAYYRNFRQIKLGILGDSDTRFVLAEYGLQMSNEAAHGIIADLLTAAA